VLASTADLPQLPALPVLLESTAILPQLPALPALLESASPTQPQVLSLLPAPFVLLESTAFLPQLPALYVLLASIAADMDLRVKTVLLESLLLELKLKITNILTVVKTVIWASSVGLELPAWDAVQASTSAILLRTRS
jgi:hypothetical protein